MWKPFAIVLTLSLSFSVNLRAVEPPSNFQCLVYDQTIAIEWEQRKNADQYFLYFAQYPYLGEHTIGKIALGELSDLDIALWEGASFYLAATVESDGEESDYSEIELMRIINDVPAEAKIQLHALDNDLSPSYLGCWNCGPFGSDSIHNQNSLFYGHKDGARSIRNHASRYGSESSQLSACNPDASNAPVLSSTDSDHLGRLSVSAYHSDSICNRQSGYYVPDECQVLINYCAQ